MTTDSAPRIKITYATLSADNEELHAQFEESLTAGDLGLEVVQRLLLLAGLRLDVDGPDEIACDVEPLAGDRAHERGVGLIA